MTHTDSRFDRYRDGRNRHQRTWGPDHWVVFHFHFGTGSNLLRRIGADTYMGTPGFTVYHASQWHQPRNGAQWRVRGNGGHGGGHSRQGWFCPQGGSLWYIGSGTRPNTQSFQVVHDWGRRLFDQGYLGSQGQRLVINAPGNGQINPQQNWNIVTNPGDTASAAGGRRPYRVNFMVDQNGQYIWNIAQPPASLQGPP